MGRLACPRLFPDMMEGVGLDYSIWSGQLSRVGSSLSDLLRHLPCHASSARLSDGAGSADPAAPMGRDVRGDPGNAARLAPAAGQPQTGLHQPTASGATAHRSRDPQARDPHGDRTQPGDTVAYKANSSRSATRSLPPRCGKSCMPPGSTPRPRRTGPTWKQFLNTQARGILAVDFVHVDTVLLSRIYALILWNAPSSQSTESMFGGNLRW